MTEEQFRIECGKDTDPEIARALVEYFRSIGWHDSARLIQDTSFEAERPEIDEQIEDAGSEGWCEGVEAAAKAVEDSDLDAEFSAAAVKLIRELVEE